MICARRCQGNSTPCPCVCVCARARVRLGAAPGRRLPQAQVAWLLGDRRPFPARPCLHLHDRQHGGILGQERAPLTPARSARGMQEDWGSGAGAGVPLQASHRLAGARLPRGQRARRGRLLATGNAAGRSPAAAAAPGLNRAKQTEPRAQQQQPQHHASGHYRRNEESLRGGGGGRAVPVGPSARARTWWQGLPAAKVACISIALRHLHLHTTPPGRAAPLGFSGRQSG